MVGCEAEIIGESFSAVGVSGTGLGLLGSTLLGFLEAIALSFKWNDLGSVDKAVDQGDHAGCVGKHLVPFGKRLIGSEHDWSVLISAGDHLKEKISVARVIRQIPHLVNDQQLRLAIPLQVTMITLSFSLSLISAFLL